MSKQNDKVYDNNMPDPIEHSDSIKAGAFRRCAGCNEEILSASEKCPFCGAKKPKVKIKW